jgi:hypothetical protein
MELRPKYFRRRKKIILPEAPHVDDPHKWLHYPGINVTSQHHAKSRAYGTIDVYWEELDKYDKIGYATNSWSYKKVHLDIKDRKGDYWMRTPIFFIWVYTPTIRSLNLDSGHIYASYAHLFHNSSRIVINAVPNRYYYAPIMVQVGKRLKQMKELELFNTQ